MVCRQKVQQSSQNSETGYSIDFTEEASKDRREEEESCKGEVWGSRVSKAPCFQVEGAAWSTQWELSQEEIETHLVDPKIKTQVTQNQIQELGFWFRIEVEQEQRER